MPHRREVSLIEITEYICFKTYEVCGLVRHGKYYLTNKGTKQNNRNQCQWSKEYPVLWHTHFEGRPFWPSAQDLVKSLKRVDTNIVFTTFQRPNGSLRFLKWTVTCPSRPSLNTAKISKLKKNLKSDMKHFFHDKKKGVTVVKDERGKKVYRVSKEKGTRTINAFVRSVNRLVQQFNPRYKLKVRNML